MSFKKQYQLKITLNEELHGDLAEIQEWYLIQNSRTLLPDIVHAIRTKAAEVRETKERLKNPLRKAG